MQNVDVMADADFYLCFCLVDEAVAADGIGDAGGDDAIFCERVGVLKQVAQRTAIGDEFPDARLAYAGYHCGSHFIDSIFVVEIHCGQCLAIWVL